MDASNTTTTAPDLTQTEVQAYDQALQQLDAVYSLELQKYRLLIAKTRQAAAAEPDLQIRPRHAA